VEHLDLLQIFEYFKNVTDKHSSLFVPCISNKDFLNTNNTFSSQYFKIFPSLLMVITTINFILGWFFRLLIFVSKAASLPEWSTLQWSHSMDSRPESTRKYLTSLKKCVTDKHSSLYVGEKNYLRSMRSSLTVANVIKLFGP
jgi:hypothetical protein